MSNELDGDHSMELTGLHDADMVRIRAEEIYRAEVRHEMETEMRALGRWRRIGRFLNSPLAIWMLTSIGVGLLSFFYSRWTESRSAQSAIEQQAANVFFEAQFRMMQMDEVIEKARARLVGNDEGATTAAMLLLFSGIRLGGVTSFPLGDEFTVWVNGSGNGNRILPAGRGFQDQEFQGQSLLNLWYSYRALTCGERPAGEEVTSLRSQFLALKAATRERVGRSEAEGILVHVDSLWNSTKSQLAMFLDLGPRFDLTDYCELNGMIIGRSR